MTAATFTDRRELAHRLVEPAMVLHQAEVLARREGHETRLRDRQPLADFQRRALMVQPDELISHAPNLCIAEK